MLAILKIHFMNVYFRIEDLKKQHFPHSKENAMEKNEMEINDSCNQKQYTAESKHNFDALLLHFLIYWKIP